MPALLTSLPLTLSLTHPNFPEARKPPDTSIAETNMLFADSFPKNEKAEDYET
jgi:hypothetical protein